MCDWPNGFSFYHFKFSSTSKTNHHLSCNNEPQTKAKRKHRYHLNTLWSIWYGILFTYLQGYLILDGAYRFLGKLFLNNFFHSPLLCYRLSVVEPNQTITMKLLNLRRVMSNNFVCKWFYSSFFFLLLFCFGFNIFYIRWHEFAFSVYLITFVNNKVLSHHSKLFEYIKSSLKVDL